jgi:hypothetical protein
MKDIIKIQNGLNPKTGKEFKTSEEITQGVFYVIDKYPEAASKYQSQLGKASDSAAKKVENKNYGL